MTGDEPVQDEPSTTNKAAYKRTIFSLKQSNLFMLEDGLVKQDNDGEPSARYRVDDIESLAAESRFSHFGFSTLLAGMGLVALGYFVIEPSNWAWLTYVLGGLIAILGAIMIREHVLVVEANGQRFSYIVQEDREELAGFAYSALEYAKEQRKK